MRTFAPEYPRDSNGLVLFPSDRNIRAFLFPYTDPTEHVAKANMLMVRALVEYVSEPGDTILDPFAGTGTILVALTISRKVIMIEIEEHFQRMIEQNVRGMSSIVPDAEELSTLIPGDCTSILPIKGFCNHMIFSPPYSNVLKKKGDTEGKMDKTSVDLGYGSATLYSSNQNNISNLNDFFYTQKMETVYRKLFASLVTEGTITVIIKDRMESGKRIALGDRAQRDCLRIGFDLVERNRWLAKGGGYAAINRAHGLETVDEEDLITLRKP